MHPHYPPVLAETYSYATDIYVPYSPDLRRHIITVAAVRRTRHPHLLHILRHT